MDQNLTAIEIKPLRLVHNGCEREGGEMRTEAVNSDEK
jgi:hypothetical protein